MLILTAAAAGRRDCLRCSRQANEALAAVAAVAAAAAAAAAAQCDQLNWCAPHRTDDEVLIAGRRPPLLSSACASTAASPCGCKWLASAAQHLRQLAGSKASKQAHEQA